MQATIENSTSTKPAPLNFSSGLIEDPLLDLETVCRLLGHIGESTLHKHVRTGAFPKPIKIQGSNRWRLSWVEGYVAQREAARA